MKTNCSMINCPCYGKYTYINTGICFITDQEEKFLFENFGVNCPVKRHPNDKKDYDKILQEFYDYRESITILTKLRR